VKDSHFSIARCRAEASERKKRYHAVVT
jgi:hypothetical protein